MQTAASPAPPAPSAGERCEHAGRIAAFRNGTDLDRKAYRTISQVACLLLIFQES